MAGKTRNLPVKPVKKGGHSFLKGPKQAGIKKSKAGKLTSVKNQIRGVQRLLSKDTLDQKIRRSLEAKLAQLQQNQAKNTQGETERKYAIRYHKVRFFERVKLERRIQQLEGKQARGHALTAEEQQALINAKGDLQYVVHFPKGERYVSILKEATEPQAQVVLAAERARLKKLIKHQMAETALIADADEGLGQNSDTAIHIANAEADAFFLEEEPPQLPASPKADAISATVLKSDSRPVTEAAPTQGKSASDAAYGAQPRRLHQQQQQHQQQQGCKRKREPEPAKPRKLHSVAAKSQSHSNDLEHPRAQPRKPRITDTSKPEGMASMNDSRVPQPAVIGLLPSQHLAPTRHTARHAAPPRQDGKTVHQQAAGRPQTHMNSLNAEQANGRRSTAAERSALLLQKLQQKHGKASATDFAIHDASRNPSVQPGPQQMSAPHRLQRSKQLHAAPQKPASKGQTATSANQIAITEHAAPPTRSMPSLAAVNRDAGVPQAASAIVPIRTRAQGGRKRRR